MAEAADPLDFRMNLFFKGRQTAPGSQEKAQAIAVLLETVAKQPDEILKSEWVKSLASRFGVEEASVLKQLRKVAVQAPRAVKRDAVQAVKEMPPIERGFIQLLLRDPSLIANAADLTPEDFTNQLARDFFTALREMTPEARAKAATSLAERFPEQAQLVMELAVADFGGEDSAVRDANGALRMLKRFSAQRRWQEMRSRIATLTPEEMEEFRKLAGRLKSSANEI
jgi:hypothetical protein